MTGAVPLDAVDLAVAALLVVANAGLSLRRQRVIRSDFEERFSSKAITPKIVKIYQQVIHEHSNQVSGRNELDHR